MSLFNPGGNLGGFQPQNNLFHFKPVTRGQVEDAMKAYFGFSQPAEMDANQLRAVAENSQNADIRAFFTNLATLAEAKDPRVDRVANGKVSLYELDLLAKRGPNPFTFSLNNFLA